MPMGPAHAHKQHLGNSVFDEGMHLQQRLLEDEALIASVLTVLLLRMV